MRILIVHPSLSPRGGAESICTGKLIRTLHSAGAKVIVVTGTEASPNEGVSYHAVPGLDGRREPQSEKLKRWCHRYPESGWNWARDAAHKISRLVVSESIDVVYTRSMPFVSHLAAYFAHRPAGVLWVAHFSDPWPDEAFFGGKRKHWRLAWHRKIVAKCDAVTFPCERVAQLCRGSQWNIQRPRFAPSIIVPHQMPDLIPLIAMNQPRRDRLVFLHCGTFYGGRQPDRLVAAWARWLTGHPELREHVQLQHVGAVSESFQKCLEDTGMTETAVQLGPVSYEQSLEKMSQAAVLVLVEGADSHVSPYLPSKFVDYLWARKPIIAITPSEGTIADVLGPRYSLRADPWDVVGIESALNRSLDAVSDPGCEDAKILKTQGANYAPKKVADDMLENFGLLRDAL